MLWFVAIGLCHVSRSTNAQLRMPRPVPAYFQAPVSDQWPVADACHACHACVPPNPRTGVPIGRPPLLPCILRPIQFFGFATFISLNPAPSLPCTCTVSCARVIIQRQFLNLLTSHCIFIFRLIANLLVSMSSPRSSPST